jgi:hypothetical protein
LFSCILSMQKRIMYNNKIDACKVGAIDYLL